MDLGLLVDDAGGVTVGPGSSYEYSLAESGYCVASLQAEGPVVAASDGSAEPPPGDPVTAVPATVDIEAADEEWTLTIDGGPATFAESCAELPVTQVPVGLRFFPGCPAVTTVVATRDDATGSWVVDCSATPAPSGDDGSSVEVHGRFSPP